MALSALLLSVAFAAPSAADPPTFQVEAEAGRFVFTRWGAPPADQLTASDRTCAIGLSWSATSGLTPSVRACPDRVVPDALAAVKDWQLAGPDGASGRQDLGEVWFVYPFDSPGRPRMLVRQSHELRWTLPDDVDPAPFQISAWSFLRYPEEAHSPDRPDVQCEVRVSADLSGYASNVLVGGCVAPFAEATRNAIADWRFNPPLVDGGPIPTSFTLTATFVAAAPVDARYHPSEESRALWQAGQFLSLSHEDRLWFIKAELLGPQRQDLGPGQVRIALPPIADFRDRPPPSYFHGEDRPRAPVRALPDHPPVMVLGEPDHEGVEVYEFPLPSGAILPEGVDRADCPVLVQVDGVRQVYTWAERGCDESVQQAVLESTDQWLLQHQGMADPTVRARIYATVSVDRAGSSVTFPASELRTPLSAAPEGVHTQSPARPLQRIPPKVPRGLTLPSGACELVVQVSVAGRSDQVDVTRCPEGFGRIASQAVRRWRWAPAERDGSPIASTAPVTIRFQP